MTEALTCAWCDEPIGPTEPYDRIRHVTAQGATWAYRHRECAMRSVIGGLNHLRGRCHCCGGDAPPDPAHLSRREAARQACVEWWRRQESHGW